jgi:hypothetical protein
MAENKTKANDKSVEVFLNSVDDLQKRADSQFLVSLMSEITGSKPKMWGESIIGFGDYRYKYASGREGDWFLAGFSPRKQNISLYIMGYLEFFQDEIQGLGKYKHGKGCLYIKRLEDIDIEVLKKLIVASIDKLKRN